MGTTSTSKMMPSLSSLQLPPLQVGHAQVESFRRKVDRSLTRPVVAARALDWTSTEERLRRPWQQCHADELPTARAKNNAGVRHPTRWGGALLASWLGMR
jgi:hypothetical protein